MKQWRKVILYSVFLSILFLGIGTKSSPIYPMNDWVDVNAFFTMGKGFIHGLVPYRDLFEQKGPLLYVIYGIAYLISNRSFLGVFLVEVTSCTVMLCYLYKILRLYHREKHFYPVAPFLLTIILTMPAFAHGGSCEELLLPCFMISLYHFLYLLKNQQYLEESNKLYFIEGMIAGGIFWTKFILLGFWIGWVFVLGFLLLKEKQVKKVFIVALSYFSGILVVTAPILFYFGIHGALKDLWDTYFYVNICIYPKEAPVLSFVEKLNELKLIFQENIKLNHIYRFSLWIGFIFILSDKTILKKWLKISIVFLFVCTFFFNYIGLKNYVYYFLVMCPFIVFFCIAISNLCERIPISTCYITIFLIPILWVFVYHLNPNTYFIGTNKNSLAQFIFADIMRKEPNPTLLYYGGIDGGFYTIANIVPTEKYFENLNFKYSIYPEIIDSQQQAIKEKHTKFIVVRMKKKVSALNTGIPYLHQNYRLIKEVEQKFEESEIRYALYKRVETMGGEVYEERNNINSSSML